MSIYKAGSRLNALRFPVAALSFAMGQKSGLHEELILDAAKRLFKNNFQNSEWKNALDEVELNRLVPMARGNGKKAGHNLNTTFGKWMYCCIRAMKPEVMLETGVAHGSSTWIILNAMHLNGKGKLISIDLPNMDPNANYNFGKAMETGWLVPAELRSQWELHTGDAKLLLPQLLKKYPAIDIFFHDSDHSYEHMKWEFDTVFPALSRNGIVLSDDVHGNNAFSEFVEKHRLSGVTFNKGGCAVKK